MQNESRNSKTCASMHYKRLSVDLKAAVSVFARAGEIDWYVLDGLGGSLYEFVVATAISVPKWQAKSLKQGLRDEALPGAVREKVIPFYAGEFCDAGVSREFTEAVWAQYKMDDNDLKSILSLAEQRALVLNPDNDRTSDVPEKRDDVEKNLGFGNMLTVEAAARYDVHAMLRVVQRISEDSGKAVPTTIVKVIEPAC